MSFNQDFSKGHESCPSSDMLIEGHEVVLQTRFLLRDMNHVPQVIYSQKDMKFVLQPRFLLRDMNHVPHVIYLQKEMKYVLQPRFFLRGMNHLIYYGIFFIAIQDPYKNKEFQPLKAIFSHYVQKNGHFQSFYSVYQLIAP